MCAAASSVVIYTCVHLYRYILVRYLYPVCTYSVCFSVKSDYIRTTKTELFPAMMVRNLLDVLGCHLSFNRLFIMFVFDSLQISSVCIQICTGCIAVTCTPLVIGLYCTILYYNLPFIKEFSITDMRIFWSFLEHA